MEKWPNVYLVCHTGDDTKSPTCQFNSGNDTECPIYVSLIAEMIQNALYMSVYYWG
jgi:hypothetical protein